MVFMGTPEFALPSLELLVRRKYDVRAIVTAPDKPRGRGQGVLPTAVKGVALREGLPVLQPTNLDDPGFHRELSSYAADIFVVVAFRILPKALIALPSIAAFNLHASLLPRYRGAAPINWALMRGEEETGVTTFLLQEKVDTGSILLQSRVSIHSDDNAGTLHDRLAERGAELVLNTVQLLETGAAQPRMQDDALATTAPKIFKRDCLLEWSKPAFEVHNKVRGLAPYPTAYTVHKNKPLKIYRTAMSSVRATEKPGSVLATPTSLSVATNDFLLSILELQQEGRRRMSVKDFLRGYSMVTGERFDSA